uniref:PHD-type zinc finger plants domain-containing protein n=1 Tax=Aegilops tauschii subsp. strangulata TaxID=200361 RepID=A0A453C364_AEGTS
MEPPPSPLGTGAGAVCCMCGDRGLPHELLRCKLCRVRLQHRYCSDLYPRATAYRRCNWCLREPAEAHAQPHAHPVASKKADKRKMVASTETSTSDEEERRQHEAGCATATRSRRSAAEVGKPVKKPKVDERPPLPPSPGTAAKGNSGDKKPMQAGKLARPGRVKVRRYKLLAEVISC